MVKLFESDLVKTYLQSSKGNQLKWKSNNKWYKADYLGYESLSEFVVSNLLKYSSLNSDEFVLYFPETISYKNGLMNGSYSFDFLKDGYELITLERLFSSSCGKSLSSSLWLINDEENRLKFIVDNVERFSGIKEFGKYMNILMTIDGLFLNEDRHMHNIAVLMKDNKYKLCPIFDNGASLLSDTTLDYPLFSNVYSLMETSKAKTFSHDFYEQVKISEKLYGRNIAFKFTVNDVDNIIDSPELDMYSKEIKERVKKIIRDQMRKYSYLFI